jgi:hypothetical protein
MRPDISARGGLTGRMITFYVVLVAITAAVVVLVVHQGGRERAQPAIAGGYDASGPNACLGKVAPPVAGAPLPPTAPAQPAASGPSFDVKQSGQFVNVSNTQGTLGGKLRLHAGALPGGGHHLTGTVNCVDGRHLSLNAIAVGGPKGAISGSLGGTRARPSRARRARSAARTRRHPPRPASAARSR